MTRPGLRSLIRRLVSPTHARFPDQLLLEQFLTHNDEAAFAALVERHGTMVLGVAWNVLRHAQDAQDVFQATFLVLARQAHAVRDRNSVGSWLHGVAHRLALKARTAAATRRRYETHTPERTAAESPDDLTWRELSGILHAELERLPERLRAPLVLCYLEGMTQDQAAEHLGVAKGTLKGRLERARLLLRGRLARLGLAPAVVLLADAYRPVGAAVPASILSTTARAAVAFAAGRIDGISTPVVRLAEGALKAMFMSRLRSVALLLAVALVVGIGVFAALEVLGRRAPPDKPDKADADRGKAVPWGEAVAGWRMRVSLPAGSEYRGDRPLPLLLEVQNVSKEPLKLKSLGWWNPQAEVTEDGKRMIVRELIDLSPWEGRSDELAAGAILQWTMDFGRLRFARQPLKAGTALTMRFRHGLPGETPQDARPPSLFSNEVALKLVGDHSPVMAGEADVPAKWTDATELIYRENIPFRGYQALRIDGAGRAWVVTSLRRGTEKGALPLTRAEVVLKREQLDRLAKFLRDQKVWELSELAKDRIPNPDEPEIRVSFGAGRGSLVRVFPEHIVRGEARLRALKEELDNLIATVRKEAEVKESRPK
jgi:RNA polymerase sigma factor (sigma-70 family)